MNWNGRQARVLRSLPENLPANQGLPAFCDTHIGAILVGMDFGVGDIDAQDLVVKVVLLVLFFSIIEEFIWTFWGD